MSAWQDPYLAAWDGIHEPEASRDAASHEFPWLADMSAGDASREAPFLPSDLFPDAARSSAQAEFSDSNAWNPAPGYQWPTQFSQQPPSADLSVQPHWDDFVSSLQSRTTYASSTGSSGGDFSNDGYGIDMLMGDIGYAYSSAGFPSAPPSSISEDESSPSHMSRPVSAAPSSVYSDIVEDNWWPFSGSLPTSAAPWDTQDNVGDHSTAAVSVSVEPYWGTRNAADIQPSSSELAEIPAREPEIDVVDEAPDMDAHLGWQWKPSTVQWLDVDVSSEVVEFPQGRRLTDKQPIYALHRVKGCPSQFPFFRQRTAFLVDFKGMDDLDPKSSMDNLLRSQDPHSWSGSTGSQRTPDAKLPGVFFGLSGDVEVWCRRAVPKCNGVAACESLDPEFLREERRELDPEPSRKLVAATLRARENQDNTEVGRTNAFYRSLEGWHCLGVRTDGVRCKGSIELRELDTPIHNKNHILLCSKREEPLAPHSVHSSTRILDHISEDLFLRAMRGESIIDSEDTEGMCARVVSGRTGAKGRQHCPFNHHKNGVPCVASIHPVTCVAKMHIFCPWPDKHPDLARMAIVVPLPEAGHTHPPPPNNKCPRNIAERYRACVRKIGISATVAKVENAQSTKELLDGKTPSVFHPGLISRDTKTRLIQQVKAELKETSKSAATIRQQVATYLADQEALPDEKRYLHSSLSRDGKRIIFGAHHKLLASIHDVRSLDCDTTFKPVVGEMQIYEINGWLVALNESVTVMRVWMEIHDRQAYKSVWEEVQRIVSKLTRKPLKFKGLHKGGKILGLNSDMEAAPLLGFADAFIGTVDREEVRAATLTDMQKCRPFPTIPNQRLIVLSGVPEGFPSEVRRRLLDLKFAKTPEEVNAFKSWILTVADPKGILKRWWDHKLMHRWLLPGLIQCFSFIPLEDWNTMESTTNLGEAQHAWNNAQTGISMGVIQSFKEYEQLDIRRAEEIELRKSTALTRNPHNEVSQRYASRAARQTRFHAKVKRAHATDTAVAVLTTELATIREELAAARRNAKDQPSADLTERVRELEVAAVDVESKLKQARAEAKSNSSGKVRASKRSTVIKQHTKGAANSESAASLPPVGLASESSQSQRKSKRQRQPAAVDSSTTAPPSKRPKRLEDPLVGWEMEDPDTGAILTGHEWVERNMAEFEERWPKHYRLYLAYIQQEAVNT